MRVRIKKQTVYRGQVLRVNTDLEIDEAVGRRWVEKGIAKRLVKASERKEEVGDGVSGVRDDIAASDVSGDIGGEPSDGLGEDAYKGERADTAGNDGKNRQRKRRSS